MLSPKVALTKNNADRASSSEVAASGVQETLRTPAAPVEGPRLPQPLHPWSPIRGQRRARPAGAETVAFETRNKSPSRSGAAPKDGPSKPARGDPRTVPRGRGRACWGRSGAEAKRQRRAAGALQPFHGHIRKPPSKYLPETHSRNRPREALRIR